MRVLFQETRGCHKENAFFLGCFGHFNKDLINVPSSEGKSATNFLVQEIFKIPFIALCLSHGFHRGSPIGSRVLLEVRRGEDLSVPSLLALPQTALWFASGLPKNSRLIQKDFNHGI